MNGAIETKKWQYCLTKHELEGIRNYKYKPGTYTYLDNVFTPYWNWVVTQLPSWAAPNLLTFTGLFLVIIWTIIILVQTPDLVTPVKGWSIIGYAGALFIYQTLDAVDGKQARRTNSSSPLGQLFDHGCDAIVTLLCLTSVAASLRLGPTWKTMLLFCNIEAAFYLAQWEEYHTGTLNWSNGYFGVTESQLTQMLLFIVTGVYGPEVWNFPIAKLIPQSSIFLEEETSILDFMLVLFTFVTGSMACVSAAHVAPMRAQDMDAIERGNKTLGLRAGLLQLLPFTAVMVTSFLLSTGPGNELFAKHTALYLLGMGAVATHVISRMIVHHMAKSPLLLHDMCIPGVLALLAATINLYWPYIGYSEHTPIPHSTMISTCICIGLCSYAWFIVGSVKDLSAHLGVRCFHLSPKVVKNKAS